MGTLGLLSDKSLLRIISGRACNALFSVLVARQQGRSLGGAYPLFVDV